MWTLTDEACLTLTADTTSMPVERPAGILRELEATLVDTCEPR